MFEEHSSLFTSSKPHLSETTLQQLHKESLIIRVYVLSITAILQVALQGHNVINRQILR